MKRLITIAFVLASASWSVADEPDVDLPAFNKGVQPLLQKYCVGCHGPTKQKAELRIDQLNPDMFASDSGEFWEEVLNQLSVGDMPPEDASQPTVAERETMTSWIHHELRRASELKRSTGGNSVLRRLTAYEYNNTLRDLLGLDLSFAKDLPTEGAAKEGFVNNSAVLGTSALHIEYFQRIGASAIRKALMLGERPESFVLEFSPEDHLPKVGKTNEQDDKPKKKRRNEARSIQVTKAERANGGVLLSAVPVLSTASKKGFSGGAKIQLKTRDIPREGPVRITVTARAIEPQHGISSKLTIALGQEAGSSASPFEILGAQDVTSSELREYTFEGRLDEFPLQPHDAKKMQFMLLQNTFHSGTEIVDKKPVLLIDSVRIEAGVYETWPPESRKRILVSDDIRTVIAKFMKRAYRRPVSDEEVARMLKLYQTLHDGGMKQEDAMVETLAAVLAAPGFLLLAEPSPVSKRRPLNDWELASRLSYFLWSSMPDDRLFGLAEQQKLSDPKTLRTEVDRMLSDEKAKAFFENFASQWLGLDAIYNVAINPEFFPNFKDETKDEMVAETIAFFTRIVKQDRSALELIDSNEAMLNGPLAKHYGIPGVAGRDLRPVNIAPRSHRGGILTHGSILTLNSSGDDTHPIKRGVWVLERLLGDPPPPPPPAVPTLAEENNKGARQSLKEKLIAHRQEDACMTCHRKIDPWGIAFENFDGVGRWRDSTKSSKPTPVKSPKAKPHDNLVFAKQKSVAAPKLKIPADAKKQQRVAYDEVNEALESLQRPHNHLRGLGSNGRPDQLRRFVGYIQKRTPAYEEAVERLLKVTGRAREEFLAEFQAANADVLKSNKSIYEIADAVSPKDAAPKRKARTKTRKNANGTPKIQGSVDPKTQLDDGTVITDLDALKVYILEQKRDDFSETLIRRMLAYSLGRYLDFTDTKSVKAIHADFKKNEFRMRRLITSIVLSEPFLSK